MNIINTNEIYLEQRIIIYLLDFLLFNIQKSNKKQLNYNQLFEFTQINNYNKIEKLLFDLDNSSQQPLSTLDSIFENDNPELSSNNYDDTYIPTKAIIKEIKQLLQYTHTQYIKNELLYR